MEGAGALVCRRLLFETLLAARINYAAEHGILDVVSKNLASSR